MQSASEEQRVLAAKNGDREAMGQLLLDQYDELARYLAPRLPELLKRQIAVEDIIQQSFTTAFCEINRFQYRGEGSVGAWLRAIANSRLQDAIKELRRKKRGGDRIKVEAKVRTSNNSVVDLITVLSGHDPTPSHVLRHRETEQAMHVAISELPDDYREVVRLRYLEGKSIQETAEIMGRSEASVRSLADRAKKKLRDALGRLSTYLSARG